MGTRAPLQQGHDPDFTQGHDYSPIPDELSKLHCPDFRWERLYNEALEELLRILAEPVPPHEYSWRYT